MIPYFADNFLMICGRSLYIIRAPQKGHLLDGRVVAKGFPQCGHRLLGGIDGTGVWQYGHESVLPHLAHRNVILSTSRTQSIARRHHPSLNKFCSVSWHLMG